MSYYSSYRAGDRVVLKELHAIPCPPELASLENYIPKGMWEYFGKPVTIELGNFQIKETTDGWIFSEDWIDEWSISRDEGEDEIEYLVEELRFKVKQEAFRLDVEHKWNVNSGA